MLIMVGSNYILIRQTWCERLAERYRCCVNHPFRSHKGEGQCGEQVHMNPVSRSPFSEMLI